MIFADLPPQYQERIVCSVLASVTYDVPANIVLAVAELENGKPGMYRRNENGSHDVGVMQLNTQYLADLSGYGIAANDVADSGCYPYMLATWRLRQHIMHDKGDVWTKAANYHSRMLKYNAVYRIKLKVAARRWAGWLLSPKSLCCAWWWTESTVNPSLAQFPAYQGIYRESLQK